jgi:hypothetical protein
MGILATTRWGLVTITVIGLVSCTGAMAPENTGGSATKAISGDSENATGKTPANGGGDDDGANGDGSEADGDDNGSTDTDGGDTGTTSGTQSDTDTDTATNSGGDCEAVGELSGLTNALGVDFKPASAWAEVMESSGLKMFTVNLSSEKTCENSFKNLVDHFECHVCTDAEKKDANDFMCNPCKGSGETRDKCKATVSYKQLSATFMMGQLDANGLAKNANNNLDQIGNPGFSAMYTDSAKPAEYLMATAGSLNFSPLATAVDAETTATIDLKFSTDGAKSYKGTAKIKVFKREAGPTVPACSTGEVLKAVLKDDN